MLTWLRNDGIWPLIILNLALWAVYHFYRVHCRRRSRSKRHPIPQVSVAELGPLFAVPRTSSPPETVVVLTGDVPPAGTDVYEAWILAVLAKRARTMFEFGTSLGRTAFLWAQNSPADGQTVTLTLGPGQLQQYRRSPGDSPRDTATALAESHVEQFVYSGTNVAYKIDQRWGDSKEFEETPYHEQMDLVFVDGSHAYSYVQSDSEKALRMLRPGGLVLWHDYRGPRQVEGVYRFLNELSRRLPLRCIERTALVFYRKPLAAAPGDE